MESPLRPRPTADKEFQGILSDPEIRKQIRKTLKGFALLYFSHHLYLAPGEHHDPMIEAMEDQLIEFLIVEGFRGCCKTTFGSLIDPIYSALETPEDYPFIIPVSDTGLQAAIQRNFEPMVKDVERWQGQQITDATAKLLIYEAFIEGAMELPKHLARPVHEYYFNPPHTEFTGRNLWSLNNAFSGAAKLLDPIPQQRAAADIGMFFKERKF